MTFRNQLWGRMQHIVRSRIQRQQKAFFLRCFETLNPGQRYVDSVHIDIILDYLAAIEHNKIKRLVVNLPPRSMKSLCISVMWPAWLLGQAPERRVIAASYSQALSNKHSLDCRAIMEAAWYKEWFQKTRLKKGQNQKHKFVTTAAGFRLATSVNSTLLGEGADYIIIDDPQTPHKAINRVARDQVIEWYQTTLSTRLNNRRRGAIVLIMQRLHELDLAGHLLQDKQVQSLVLPAVSEQEQSFTFSRYRRPIGDILNAGRNSLDSLAQIKAEIGEATFAAQYQQYPLSMQSKLIKKAWLQRYRVVPDNALRYQSWDCAIKVGEANDFSVCMTWVVVDNCYYIEDIWREKVIYPKLKQQIMRQAECYHPHAILIEDKASGQQLLQDLRHLHAPIIGINPEYDKYTRLLLVSPYFEAGRVWLPYSADWLGDFEMELMTFPSGVHDDQIDAMTQFLLYIARQMRSQSSMHMLRRL